MRSIFSKVGLAITSLVIFILVLLWIFQIGFLSRYYFNERVRNLISEGNKIASLIEQSKEGIDITSEIDSFSSSFNAKIYIINTNGYIIFSKNDMLGMGKVMDVFIGQVDIASILEGKNLVKQSIHPRLETSFLTVGVPIRKDRDVVGAVILSVSLAPVQETTTILKKQLSIISIISLIIATILSFLLAKFFTNPILKITQAAQEIAKGDFNAKVTLHLQDEIGALGDTINSMAKQLGQIEKFRKSYITNVSHELRTPLSLIRAYAESIIDIYGDDKTERENKLKIIIEEANRLNKMAEDILCLSKMEAGYDEIHLVKFPVVRTIEGIIKKLSFLSSKHGTEIDLQYDDKEILLNGDENKIEQVFSNIIHNAIIHSFQGGKVEINVSNADDGVRVEVRDNGKGIPKEDLPYIWDRFYKVDKSRKRDSGGTGIGLSIVKNILEAHHFQYGLESKLNEGTTVWFQEAK